MQCRPAGSAGELPKTRYTQRLAEPHVSRLAATTTHDVSSLPVLAVEASGADAEASPATAAVVCTPSPVPVLTNAVHSSSRTTGLTAFRSPFATVGIVIASAPSPPAAAHCRWICRIFGGVKTHSLAIGDSCGKITSIRSVISRNRTKQVTEYVSSCLFTAVCL